MEAAMSRLRFVWSLAVMLSVVFVGPNLNAAPFDGEPKVLLHLMQPTGKNTCGRAQLSDCAAAVTNGALNTPYYVYVLVARGNFPHIGGFEFGIAYDRGMDDGRDNHWALDVFSWSLCASIEFPSPEPRTWPEPGSGNLVTWNTETVCQTGPVAVAGYFYVAAYSPDVLEIAPRPSRGAAIVSTCEAMDETIPVAGLGQVRFSASGTDPGCNPCTAPCTPVFQPLCYTSSTLFDFGTVTLGGSSHRTLTIRNGAAGVLEGTLIENHPEFSIDSDPHYRLFASQSATFNLTFTPSAAGLRTVTIEGGCSPITLRGTGQEPVPEVVCRVFPNELQFGYVPFGESRERTFEIRNQGLVAFVADLRLFTGLFDNCSGFALQGPTQFTVVPGDTVPVTVVYTPAMPEETASCTIMGTGCQYVYLSGNSVAPQGCRMSPVSVDYGELYIGQTADRTISVTNFGTTIWSGALSPCYSDFHVLGDPTYQLAPGQAATFTIRFAPTVQGLHHCNLSGGCVDYVGLRGYARTPTSEACVVLPSTLDFHYVAPGDSAYQSFVIYNSGNVAVSGRAVEACPSFQVAAPDSFHLEPNESDTMLVIFRPADGSLATCTIEVGGCGSITCSGNTLALPTISPSSLDFGYVPVGDSSSASFVIANVTSFPITGTAFEDCRDFRVESPDYAIPPGESRAFEVVFRPIDPSPQECSVQPVPGVPLRCVGNMVVPVVPTTWSSIKSRFMR
jgi:hypothetical protein